MRGQLRLNLELAQVHLDLAMEDTIGGGKPLNRVRELIKEAQLALDDAQFLANTKPVKAIKKKSK